MFFPLGSGLRCMMCIDYERIDKYMIMDESLEKKEVVGESRDMY